MHFADEIGLSKTTSPSPKAGGFIARKKNANPMGWHFVTHKA
jgi:hypothetical protein